ncbi:MAG: peptidase U32 family protein [Promethearchaeota archaeon]
MNAQTKKKNNNNDNNNRNKSATNVGSKNSKKSKKKVELLAPAKNIKAIKAGIKYADAFYFGAQKLNMRMMADNFSYNVLKKAVKMLHDRGKKAYFVTNVLVYEEELEELRSLIADAKAMEFDAAIIFDIAALEFAREEGLPFHISTQANISNSKSAQFFEKLGAERIILAREVNFEQMKQIIKKLHKAEIEVFIHGAMCTMVSGRCYFSMDMHGSREFSANRGRCSQPCRREWRLFDDKGHEYIYDGVRFLNSRDLCNIEYIPELVNAGVASLKIEGRTREPHYVEIVTKVYREAIEQYYQGNFTETNKKMVGKWINELKKEYNRGFTNGFLFKRPTEEDHQHKSPTNLSHWRMIKLGSIEKYSKKRGMAYVKLINGAIWNGMEVIIQGDYNSDTYFHQKIRNIEENGVRIKRTKKATEKSPIWVWIKTKEPVRGNYSDSIFVFTNETYKNREKYKSTLNVASPTHQNIQKEPRYSKNKNKNFYKL